MKKKIGFNKKIQGIFDAQMILQIKESLSKKIDCEIIDVDFREGVIINDRVFVNDICLNDLDLYFWHDTVYPRVWGADNHFLHILSVLEKTTPVVNSSNSTRIVNDKFLAHSALKNAHIPVGDFALVRADDTQNLRRIFSLFNNDVLLKPRFGGWGIGIARATKIDELLSTVEYMMSFVPRSHQSILIEKFHKNDLSKWISVALFGDKILFGYRKQLMGDADWKIYDPKKIDGKGLLSTFIDPPQEAKNIVLAAQKAIGKDIIGFDLIYTEDGYKIIDENGRPGLYKNCIDTAGIDIASEITVLVEKKFDQI